MQPEDLQPGEERTSDFRAAEYVRMSTEHQQYSTQNQADKIREYADRRGISIIRTYADEGKSGLRIDGREALQALCEKKHWTSTLSLRRWSIGRRVEQA